MAQPNTDHKRHPLPIRAPLRHNHHKRLHQNLHRRPRRKSPPGPTPRTPIPLPTLLFLLAKHHFLPPNPNPDPRPILFNPSPIFLPPPFTTANASTTCHPPTVAVGRRRRKDDDGHGNSAVGTGTGAGTAVARPFPRGLAPLQTRRRGRRDGVCRVEFGVGG